MLSLPTWNAVVQVVEGKDGLMKSVRRGQIVMDTSTSPPWESRAMGEKLAKKGVEWLDVPISGSSAQARLGNMVFMVGGEKNLFEKVKTVLDRIGKKTHAGKAWGRPAAVNLTLYLNQGNGGLVLGLCRSRSRRYVR
jgi:3-hydroxyisobutyrate dehydrogenase-like beta-hydroxyacid dehydrogenase